VTKPKPSKKGNNVLDEVHPRETRERQPSSQWGYGQGDECCVYCALLFVREADVVKLEILEVREESDEVQDLSARAPGISEGEESKGW